MNKIDWMDLTHKINWKMVEFRREHGKSASTLVVGREEYAILEANKSSGDFETGIDGKTYSLWSMNVRLDESKNSHLELIGKKVNFLKIVDYPFTSYRVKVEVVVPSRLRVPFVSFLDSQNTSDIGVQIVGGKKELPRANKDLVYYQVSVEGINKDMVAAFVNYLYEIEKAYTVELTCDTCGTHRWVECRDTHYNNHLDGSKDICKECKIHE
jgi:hypothetical protein